MGISIILWLLILRWHPLAWWQRRPHEQCFQALGAKGFTSLEDVDIDLSAEEFAEALELARQR